MPTSLPALERSVYWSLNDAVLQALASSQGRLPVPVPRRLGRAIRQFAREKYADTPFSLISILRFVLQWPELTPRQHLDFLLHLRRIRTVLAYLLRRPAASSDTEAALIVAAALLHTGEWTWAVSQGRLSFRRCTAPHPHETRRHAQ